MNPQVTEIIPIAADAHRYTLPTAVNAPALMKSLHLDQQYSRFPQAVFSCRPNDILYTELLEITKISTFVAHLPLD